MTVVVKKLTGLLELRRACEMTLRPGMTSRASLASQYRCEHSPIRTQMFWVELLGVETFVSTHLVRHKQGVEHFVQSNRDDRRGGTLTDEQITRLTPVNHGLLINAAALIAMSCKRLCLMSHKRTVAWWTKVRGAVSEVDPDLANHMVPECVRRGFCPEMRECKPGAAKIIEAYSRGNPAYAFRLEGVKHEDSTSERG